MNNRLLKQIFTIPLSNEKNLVYAPLKRVAFIANTVLVNNLFNLCRCIDRLGSSHSFYPELSTTLGHDNGIMNLILDSDFFTAEPEPEDEYEKDGAIYDTVTLFPTNECNLRCVYCYASSGEHEKKKMPWKIAKAGIDMVFRSVVENELPSLHLGFHGGGEPSLNENILKRACEYANYLCCENNIELSISGAFNGFMPDQTERYIIENLTDLSLSFDGLPEVQNAQRPTRDGKSSFTRVTGFMRAMDDAKFPYGVRMTVTDQSVARFEDSIDFICKNFNPRAIQVEPVFSQGRARRNRLTAPGRERFIDQFLRGKNRASARGIPLLYSGARLDAISQRFCMAPCRALILTPNGDITTCYEAFDRSHPENDKFIIGKYSGNGCLAIDREKLANRLERTAAAAVDCRSCFCKWHCAGDCAGKIFENRENSSPNKTDRCTLNRELIIHMILDKIRQNGGWIWNGPVSETF
jgi:uncharacterized protein